MMTRSRSLCLARRAPTAPPPPQDLIDDAIAEILLRLPPDEPACLVRASLVCKLWRHILSDPSFPHRYREFHRTPPLLGILPSTTFYSDSKRSRLIVPITRRTPFPQPLFVCRPLDCRHGRILLDLGRGKRENLAVWDPATGGHKFLTDPDPKSVCRCAGAVLCAAADCNHLGCHGGAFIVVSVSTSYHAAGTKASAWVHSSDRGAWSAPASVQIPAQQRLIVDTKRAALVGDRIYFLLAAGIGILEYDLGKHCLTMICVPRMCPNCDDGILMSMEDGSSLGLAAVKDSTLHLWARTLKPNGYMGWVKDRVISLNNNLAAMIPAHRLYRIVNVIGFAEGLDILLLGGEASGFMFELKSGRFKKLSNNLEYHYFDVYPYLSFYIPDFASHKSLLPVERRQDNNDLC